MEVGELSLEPELADGFLARVMLLPQVGPTIISQAPSSSATP